MGKKKYCFKCLEEILSVEQQHYGLHASPCFQVWFQEALDPFTNEFPVFQSLVRKSQADSSASPILSSNFQGRYKKYSAVLGTKHYILKVEEEKYPELPATEYLCNQIADFLKIPVPLYRLIRFEDAENNFVSFVTSNFMSDLPGTNLKHIYHYLNKPFENFNCQIILEVIKSNSIRKKDVKIFIEMCLFDALIGNHDRHGRNLGFIETSKGKFLSPIYDNPSYVGIEEELFLKSDLEPKGKISTQHTNDPTMKDYVIEFKRLGFQNIISNFKKNVKLEKIFYLIDNSFISVNRKLALKNLIKKRYKELKDE